jgi:Glycosyl transferase family 11
MFQYAAGRRLAFVRDVPLKLHIVPGENVATPRPYNLHAFDILGEWATPDEIERLKGQPVATGLFVRLLSRLSPPPARVSSFVVERHFQFDPEILDLPGNVYLEGYWQSEKYFRDCEDVIRKEFSMKIPMSPSNEQMAHRIAGEESAVSIHVRRGDYVSDAGTNRFHGTCSVDYYRKAVDRICGFAPASHFFVFSDGIDWAKENLRLRQPVTYVDFNDDEKNYEDLRLMGLCTHHIIANSSFSWWGAWLNPNPDKIVIAPKKWFNDPSINTDDLMPKSWLRL